MSPESANPISTAPDFPREVCEAVEKECIETALQLRSVLNEESDLLKRFASNELLWLMPRKELLIGELQRSLPPFKRTDGSPAFISDNLKNLLSEIDEQNRSNGLFIKKSLSYWQDLLLIFSPRGYGRDSSSRPGGLSPRGISFCREI